VDVDVDVDDGGDGDGDDAKSSFPLGPTQSRIGTVPLLERS